MNPDRYTIQPAHGKKIVIRYNQRDIAFYLVKETKTTVTFEIDRRVLETKRE